MARPLIAGPWLRYMQLTKIEMLAYVQRILSNHKCVSRPAAQCPMHGWWSVCVRVLRVQGRPELGRAALFAHAARAAGEVRTIPAAICCLQRIALLTCAW